MSEKSGTENKVLERKVVYTADGSTSLIIPDMDEMYHSRKGAIIESKHVYVDHGLSLVTANEINVLEIGMGTGLNVFLSVIHAKDYNKHIHFETLEPFPLTEEEWSLLNFDAYLPIDKQLIITCHQQPANFNITLNERFILSKYYEPLETFTPTKLYDIVLFDAFAPNKQSKPWSLSNIQKVYDALKPDGILTTYCAQGQFKRDLRTVGFDVTNPAGPLGKREITVAYKKKSLHS